MAQQTETQSYEVIEKHDNIEIRYYPPAAKVMSKGKINETQISEIYLITFLVKF